MDDCLVLWVDDLLIYSQTEEECLRHIKLIFKNSMQLESNRKCLHMNFSKAITDLALATNISGVRQVKGLIGYYSKIFPIFIDVI